MIDLERRYQEFKDRWAKWGPQLLVEGSPLVYEAMPAPKVNWFRRAWARLTRKKAEWISLGKASVFLGMPCTIPRCPRQGLWSSQEGWICKKHRELRPEIMAEIRKAWPHVGVNGPSIWVRLPIERDVRKTAWMMALHDTFGLVELPGWIT